MVTAERTPTLDLSAPIRMEFGFEYVSIRLPAEWRLTEEAFLEICSWNDGWGFEATAAGDLIVMPPASRKASSGCGHVLASVGRWSRGGGGETFGPDGLVHLPDNAMKAPDCSWLSPARTEEKSGGYDGELIPVCPDFVVEVRNVSDSVGRQQEKMEQWMAYGARLGWLVDAYSEKVWVYRAGRDEPEELEKPDQLSGEDVLPGLVVDMEQIWD